MNRENLFCWVDIHEYHSIPTLDYRRCMAFQIFAKYLKEGAPMRVGGLQNTVVEDIAEQIRKARQVRSWECVVNSLCFKATIAAS